MKLIFLDIDGVLNHQSAYERGECGYVPFPKELELSGIRGNYSKFALDSKKYLNQLIHETGAKIVVSSTWRASGLEWMRKVWQNEGMEGEILDITPRIDTKVGNFEDSVCKVKYAIDSRGTEIEAWLRHNGFYHINWSEKEQHKVMEQSGIENYIILDDDSDMLYEQRNHFVHVLPAPRNKDGFNESYYREARARLLQDVITLNYYFG